MRADDPTLRRLIGFCQAAGGMGSYWCSISSPGDLLIRGHFELSPIRLGIAMMLFFRSRPSAGRARPLILAGLGFSRDAASAQSQGAAASGSVPESTLSVPTRTGSVDTGSYPQRSASSSSMPVETGCSADGLGRVRRHPSSEFTPPGLHPN